MLIVLKGTYTEIKNLYISSHETFIDIDDYKKNGNVENYLDTYFTQLSWEVYNLGGYQFDSSYLWQSDDIKRFLIHIIYPNTKFPSSIFEKRYNNIISQYFTYKRNLAIEKII